MKAVFLDRDGVVNTERGEYTFKIEDFQLNDGLVEFCKRAKANDFLIFVISNQGGVAKGIYTLDDVKKVHDFLEEVLLKNDIKLTDIYFCPHHQNFGACLCRKPNALLFERAIAKHNVNVQESFMLGDRERDIQAANAVGLKGILIPSNANLLNYLNLLDE